MTYRNRLITIMAFFICSMSAAENKHSLYVEGGINSILATKDTFFIEVEDQVTGGCLPNPKALKDKFEISLRRNNFNIQEKQSMFSNDIIINAIGYANNDYSCAVWLEYWLRFGVFASVPYANSFNEDRTLVQHLYRIRSGLLTGSKNDMQSRLQKETLEAADELFLDISRAKDKTFSKFPEIKEQWLKVKKAD